MTDAEKKNAASFSSWEVNWKKQLKFHVLCTASMDSDTYRQYSDVMTVSSTLKHKEPLNAVVSVYTSAAENGEYRSTGLMCQYMVPRDATFSDIQFAKNVLEVDFQLQTKFVNDVLLSRHDTAILKMYGRKNAGGVEYIALFKDHGVTCIVSRASDSEWGYARKNGYRLCTSTMVGSFPYDERSKYYAISRLGSSGWSEVTLLGGPREGADLAPDILHSPDPFRTSCLMCGKALLT